jgi:hypothetical protein
LNFLLGGDNALLFPRPTGQLKNYRQSIPKKNMADCKKKILTFERKIKALTCTVSTST